MKTLPDSPNLDHLRQQAKDVLQQLRAVRPEATLSDAQARVAERYGFRTWSDLKAEVDRRRSAGRHAGADVTAAVAGAFDLGAPAGPMRALARQWAGQAWTLTTDRGRWLARELFEWIDDSPFEDEVLLAETAAAAGIVTPRPVRSPSGAIVVRTGGSPWRIYTLPAVGPEPTVPADPRHARAAGRIVGRVHGLRLPAPGCVGSWLTQVRPESQWWELQRAAASTGRPWADRLAEVIPGIVDAGGIVEPADAAGEPVLSGRHYPPDAFCLAGGDELAVMTWEHAGPIPPRWDFGSTLAAWSEGVLGTVNEAAARAVVAGYATEHELPDPLDVGIFSAALCASLSWLASRIGIALTAEDEGRRELAERSVPWLLEAPPSRARFQAVLDAVR